VADARQAGGVLSRVRGIVPAALLCAAAIGAGVPAPAAADEYAAEYVSECCFASMEQGDELDMFFQMRNTGTAVWNQGGPNPVKVGTQDPENRASEFYLPGNWESAGRPSLLDEPAVNPGQQTTFSFRIRAPQRVGFFHEVFRLVAEGNVWFGTGLYLDWNVLAAQSPQIRITSAPARSTAGSPIELAAEATDNLAVQRVTFSIGGRTVDGVRDADTNTWRGTLDSTGLAPGTHTIVAKAFDRGAREGASTSDVEIVEPSRQTPPETPPGPTEDLRRLTSNVALTARRIGRRSMRVDRLEVTAPRGSRIVVRCQPRRCSPTFVRATRRRTTVVRFTHAALRTGTRVVVAVTKQGFVGERTTFSLRPGKLRGHKRAIA
jgi:Big-like domain-containing protein/Ig-like domain-containing protein